MLLTRSLPDLEVRDRHLSFANTSPIEGAQVDVYATVRNLGADVDGVVVHFYDGEINRRKPDRRAHHS